MKISIDRAIEILDPTHREHYGSIEKVNEACRMGMEALKRTRWIPVAERLPEEKKDGYYILLSFENYPLTVIGRYEEDYEGGAFYAGDDDETLVSHGVYVNAWMPLPEPYKPESEEK